MHDSTATIPATAAPVADADDAIAARIDEWKAARRDHQVVRDAHRAALNLALAMGRLLDRMGERAADLDHETAAALIESGPFVPADDVWRYEGSERDGLLTVLRIPLDFDPDGPEAPPVAGHACVEIDDETA